MKRTYLTPAMLAVTLNGRDALLQTLSDSTTGIGSGGSTSKEGVTDADVKEHGKNIWDEEW